MIRGSIPHLLLLIYLLSANSLLVIIFLLHQKIASKVNIFVYLVEAILVSGQNDGFLLSGECESRGMVKVPYDIQGYYLRSRWDAAQYPG